METLSKALESKTRIQYQDCDPFNHLNNSRYIDYIVAARTEQLLSNYGFNSAEIAKKEGVGWVSAQNQLSYFNPASWMERVTIESRLIQYSDYSLLIEGLMWDEHKKSLKCLMWAKLVHFDIKTQRSHKHSDALMKLFSEIRYPLEQNFTFEERANFLKPKK
jgi:acyl-CoA thioester hydrolase